MSKKNVAPDADEKRYERLQLAVIDAWEREAAGRARARLLATPDGPQRMRAYADEIAALATADHARCFLRDARLAASELRERLDQRVAVRAAEILPGLLRQRRRREAEADGEADGIRAVPEREAASRSSNGAGAAPGRSEDPSLPSSGQAELELGAASPLVNALNRAVEPCDRWCTPSILREQPRVDDVYTSDISISAARLPIEVVLRGLPDA